VELSWQLGLGSLMQAIMGVEGYPLPIQLGAVALIFVVGALLIAEAVLSYKRGSVGANLHVIRRSENSEGFRNMTGIYFGFGCLLCVGSIIGLIHLVAH
jgi:hypothetical protein